MKNKFLKRIIAVILSVVMVCSMATVGIVSASAITPEQPSIWKSGAQGFGVSKIYGVGLSVVGCTLVDVAKASECEEFISVASFINIWVCGGNPTTQTLGEIQKLCNEILSEVKQIDAKLDLYSSTVISELAKQNYGYLCDAMNSKWDKMKACENSISKALDRYFDYDDIDTKITTNSNNISYFVAASCYKNETPDKNGKYYTLKDVQEKRGDLFEAFCNIHSNMPANAVAYKEKADVLFGDSMVDDIMQKAIADIIDCIESAEYANACAKVAYAAYPNLSDQYKFVNDCINRQFMELCLVEMLYQEYLAMRGEYLEACYPYDENNAESVAMWNVYNGDRDNLTKSDVEQLSQLNSEAIDAMENLIDTPLTLNTTGLTLKLGEYVKPEDLTGVVLQNTSHISRFEQYGTERPILEYCPEDARNIYSGYKIPARTTSKYMTLDKIAVPTNNGIEIYYMTDGSTKDLIYCNPYAFGIDHHLPTCDFFNLTRGTFTDGVNTFTCVTKPQDQSSLFNTSSYGLYSSNPAVYLSAYYTDRSDRDIYQIFPDYDFDNGGWLTDTRAIFTALQMNKVNVGMQNSTTTLDGKNSIYENSNAPYYTAIYKCSSNQLKNTIASSVSGTGSAEIYITDENNNTIANGSNLNCGDELTVHFKKTNDNTEYQSLQILRYNNASNKDKVTSVETVLERSDFENIKYDSKTGYYSVNINMPYSNAKVVLNTTTGKKISVINTINDSTITLHSNDNVFLAGDVVTFEYPGMIDHVTLQYNGESHNISMEYSKRTGVSIGSFTMPDYDVIVSISNE